jgi:peroxiredoxin
LKKPIKRKRNNYMFLLVCGVVLLLVLIIFLTKQITSYNSNNQPGDENISDNQTVSSEQNEQSQEFMNYIIPIESRKKAPEFVLNSIDDETVTLKSLNGKIVLLDFTATWCSWCERQAPDLVELYKNYNNKGFTVLSIDCKEDLQTVKNKYSISKNIYPILLDQTGDIANSYSIQGYPAFFLIDKNGNIAYNQSGYKEDMKDIVGNIIEYINNKE